MSTYSFTIRKGKYQLDLTTSDKELLVSQFEQWVKQAGAYAKKRKAKAEEEVDADELREWKDDATGDGGVSIAEMIGNTNE